MCTMNNYEKTGDVTLITYSVCKLLFLGDQESIEFRAQEG